MSNFLYRQTSYLLKNKPYAYFLVIALALIPFVDWLSLSIVALITLRKGGYEGFKIMLPLITVTLVGSFYQPAIPFELSAILVSFAFAYFGALALRASVSWTMLLAFMLTVSLLIIALIHSFFPEAIGQQFKTLLHLFQNALAGGEPILQRLSALKGLQADLVANYFLGIKMLSIVASALTSLMLARYLQSVLYYPGGFREEILQFRAARPKVLLLLIVALGAYQHYPLAVSFLPLLLIYVMAAGMLVFFKAISRKKDWVTMLFLLIPLIIAPYVMLPVYVLFGSLDSLFHFKLRLPSKAAK